MKPSFVSLSLALLLALFGIAQAGVSNDADDLVKGQHAKKLARTYKAVTGAPAPDFELQDISGETVRLSELRGKTVVLEWFNPDCPWVVLAHSEKGSLTSMGNDVSQSGDVVWLAINSGAPGNQGTGAERNTEAAKKWGLEHPILLDEAGYVGRMYGAKTTPHMFVIDADGILAYSGAIDNAKDKDAPRVNYVADAIEDLKAGRELRTASTKPYGCGVKYTGKAKVGLSAPGFHLTDLDGNDVNLADHRGEVVVLEWFNPECPVVKRAHASGGALETAASRWTEKGVVWLAINSGAPGNQGTGVEKNVAGKQKFGLSHPILLDEKGKVGKRYGAKKTPHMFIVDRRGVLAYAGAHDDKAGTSYIDQALIEILAGKEVSNAKTQAYGCSVKY